MAYQERTFDTAIIGGGSAATGFAAAVERRSPGALQKYAETKGIVVIASSLGAGLLADYGITGNSTPSDFVSGTPKKGVFSSLRYGRNARYLEATTAPVRLDGPVTNFLEERAATFRRVLDEAPASDVLLGTKVTSVKQRVIDREKVHVLQTDDGEEVVARKTILATGGKEKSIAGFHEAFGDRYILSGSVINGTALEAVKEALLTGRNIAFVAASHSTYATIDKILKEFDGQVEKEQLVVLSKKEPEIYFPSRKAAQKAGYQYGRGNICRKTGRINRFGGLRNHAADVVLRGDQRVRFEKVTSIEKDDPILQSAGLIISGIGYETNIVPIFDEFGTTIGPLIEKDGQVAVDKKGRVLGIDGKRLDNIFGTGLGYGPRPTRRLGGEPNFTGRLDGVNVSTDIVGPIIAEQVVFKRG